MLLQKLQKIFVHFVQGKKESVIELANLYTTKEPFSTELSRGPWLRLETFSGKMGIMEKVYMAQSSQVRTVFHLCCQLCCNCCILHDNHLIRTFCRGAIRILLLILNLAKNE
nr:peptidyl-prolyl cis-trans isomerase CYP95-like isoform X1 [Ipomoea batatas]GMD92176.1 peptidyl-prolyl cis-trans isomerase CYP95-like isoform X1 [Ipomoea batatas]